MCHQPWSWDKGLRLDFVELDRRKLRKLEQKWLSEIFFWNYDENILFGPTDVPACEGCEEGGEARHEEQVVGGVVGEAEHGGGQQHDHHNRDAVQGLQGEDIC